MHRISLRNVGYTVKKEVEAKMIKRIEKIFAGLKRGIDILGTHFLAGQKRQDVWTRHRCFWTTHISGKTSKSKREE